MRDVLIGLLALAVGALFCFRGFMTMRLVIPIWGAFTGFVLGAGLTESFTDDDFLGSAVSWVVGILVAVLFGLIAYLYYEVSVIIAMAAVGFALGTSVLVAIGVTWSWLIVLAGVAAGVLLAVAAIVADLPAVLLVVLTALAGSSIMVFGAMLVFGTIDATDLQDAATTDRLDDDWWWYLAYVVLAVAGLVAQLRSAERRSGTMRDTWANEGGREFRRN